MTLLAPVITLALAPSALSTSSDPLFVTTDTFATGSYTFLIDEGDADGDGASEFAIASLDGVTVLRRDGASVLTPDTGHPPAPLVTAALIPHQGPFVGIFSFSDANTSDFKFTQVDANGTGWETQTVLQLDSPRGGIWADFNNDQLDDFAICSVNAGTVTMLPTSIGPGGSAQTVAGFDRPLHLTAADFNGDGNEDLVVASQNDSEFVLLLGDGTGAFVNSGAISPTTTDLPIWSHPADMDGDGDVDLILAYQTGGRLEVWRNDGTGATASIATVASPFSDLQCVTALDYDLDGDVDLAATAMTAGKVIVFEAAQAGTWTPHAFDAPDARILVASDWDLDGDDDLLVSSWSAAGGVSVLTNVTDQDCDGDGQVDALQIAADPALDWNGDGLIDTCAGGGFVHCGGNLNATGSIGRLMPQGSPAVVDDAFTLSASDLPSGQPGMFIMSRADGFVNPCGGGAGVLCLGPPIRRFNPAAGFPVQFTGTSGVISLTPPIAQFPGPSPVLPGDVLYFQLWHRENDPTTGAPRSNTTDGIRVMFR